MSGDGKSPKKMTALDRHHRVARKVGFFGRLRAYLAAGILVTAPLGITIYLAIAFISFMDDLATRFVPPQYNPETYLPFSLPGLGLITVIVFLILVGWLTAGFFGSLFLKISEFFLNRMPVVRNIYSALKQVLETVLARKSNAFRDVALIEYPRKGIWSLGFVTGKTQGQVQDLTDDEVINIFLPTTPNPTSGFLLFVPRKELKILDMSVEDGLKMVISAGMVTPAQKTVESKPSQSADT